MFTQAAPGKAPGMQELPPAVPAPSLPGYRQGPAHKPLQHHQLVSHSRAPDGTSNFRSYLLRRRRTIITAGKYGTSTDKALYLLTEKGAGGEI